MKTNKIEFLTNAGSVRGSGSRNRRRKKNESGTNTNGVNCNNFKKLDHCFDTDDKVKCESSYMGGYSDIQFACKWNTGSSISSRCEPNMSEKCNTGTGSSNGSTGSGNGSTGSGNGSTGSGNGNGRTGSGSGSGNDNSNGNGNGNGNGDEKGTSYLTWFLWIMFIGIIIGLGYVMYISNKNPEIDAKVDINKKVNIVDNPPKIGGKRLKNKVR